MNIKNLEKDIAEIKARNKRVEKDKEWETSLARRVSIAVITYTLICIFLIIIEVEKPFISAIIPAFAYLVSTASLNLIKNWWLKSK